MRRAAGIELRRGVEIWAAAPMTLALAWIVLAHPRAWAGDWGGWAYYLRTSLIVFGPIVVAAAAWQGEHSSASGHAGPPPRTPPPTIWRRAARAGAV